MKSILLAAALLIPAMGTAMTFEELSEAAYEQSLQKIETDGKRQSLQLERDAFFAMDPLTLEGSVRKIRADEPSGDGTEAAFMVGMTVWNPALREAQRAQYDALMQSLERSDELKRTMIRIALKREYLLSLLSKEALEITQEKRQQADAAYAMAVKKFDAGRIPQMEMVRFGSESDAAAKEVRDWEIEVRRHQDALREQTMREGEIVVDDLRFGFVSAADDSALIGDSVLLKTYASMENELDRSIEAVRRSRVESINVGVGMTQEPTQNSVDFRISVPLAVGSKNEKKIAALMAQRSALVHQREWSRETLLRSLSHTRERLETLRQAIDESGAAAQRHEALYRMARKGFEGGVVGLFEYLETKNRFYGAKLQTLELKRNYVETVSAMEEKMGRMWE